MLDSSWGPILPLADIPYQSTYALEKQFESSLSFGQPRFEEQDFNGAYSEAFELDQLCQQLTVRLEAVQEEQERENSRTIRKLRKDDIEAVQLLHSQLLPITYPTSFYSSLLSDPSIECLIVHTPLRSPTSSPKMDVYSPTSILSDSTELLGVISAKLHSSGTSTPRVYILSLAVQKGFQSQGIASTLFNNILKELTNFEATKFEFDDVDEMDLDGEQEKFGKRVWVSLHVEASNASARAFYKNLGLKEKKLIRGHYNHCNDGIEVEGLIYLR